MALEQSELAKALDAYAPAQIADRVEQAGLTKARLPARQTVTLAILAGAYIAFGAMLYTLVLTGADPTLGSARLLAGFAFSLGLVLVVIAGAELFTGNNLIVFAWADRRLTTRALLRNWCLVYFGNFIGAAATAGLGQAAGLPDLLAGAMGKTAWAISQSKLSLSFLEAFSRGVLCNLLVCLALWMCFSARRITGKILCLVFPVTAFVALGFEHSIANMYLIPAGFLAHSPDLDLQSLATALWQNLLPVTLGNLTGGGLLVAGVYWLVYGRNGKA